MEEPDATVDGSEILHHLIDGSSHYLQFCFSSKVVGLGISVFTNSSC